MACNNCGAIQIVLSTAFFFFALSVLSAFYLQIARVRTVPKLNDQSSTATLSVSTVAFATGFLLDGVSLIMIGQREIGTLIVGLVVLFTSVVLFQFWRPSPTVLSGRLEQRLVWKIDQWPFCLRKIMGRMEIFCLGFRTQSLRILPPPWPLDHSHSWIYWLWPMGLLPHSPAIRPWCIPFIHSPLVG